jgi:TPP-dependent pyruvate/acetoin dehydrogenase alpha subunit
MDNHKLEKFHYKMLLIRRFEERLLDLFSKGELSGTTHSYIGQEAIAVGVLNNLNKNDIVISNHRCHGHYIAYNEDVLGLLSEIMGKVGGICGGRGGSQHIHKNNFFSNGVQGNMVPVTAGMAYAKKLENKKNIVVIFVGDGTFGQGIIYETLNMLSLWELPLLMIVENNRYAQTTPLKLNFAGSFEKRIKAFDISALEIESNDVEILNRSLQKITKEVRMDSKPYVVIINTYRLGPHSKGDDFRPKNEIEKWKQKDPLPIIASRLSTDQLIKNEKRVETILTEAEREARAMSFPDKLDNKEIS